MTRGTPPLNTGPNLIPKDEENNNDQDPDDDDAPVDVPAGLGTSPPDESASTMWEDMITPPKAHFSAEERQSGGRPSNPADVDSTPESVDVGRSPVNCSSSYSAGSDVVGVSPASPAAGVSGENEVVPDGELAPFSVNALVALKGLISRARWIVPVLPKGELPVLLRESLAYVGAGRDEECPEIKDFLNVTLPACLLKLMTDDAVKEWKSDIQRAVLECTRSFISLAVSKLDNPEYAPLVDCLSFVFDPRSRFHIYNATKPSIHATENIDVDTPQTTTEQPEELEMRKRFAIAPSDLIDKYKHTLVPKEWFVDLLNYFGILGGFEKVLGAFRSASESSKINFAFANTWMKPFGLCCDYLRPDVVVQFLMEPVELCFRCIQDLSDDELRKESSKSDSKDTSISILLKFLRVLALKATGRQNLVADLEMYRLKLLLRLLQVSSFGGKMNALNEINRFCNQFLNAGYFSSIEDDGISSERLLAWIKQSQVLNVLLRENLHQPQYVERLDKILRFLIKSDALSTADMDNLWAAQIGKHDAIVKNIHSLLAKLAWDFNQVQLQHFFQCFKSSWRHSTTKEREQLLELMRHLAEDDKEGVMAKKVLELLWNVAHSPDLPIETIDSALQAHLKILDYGCSGDRDRLKMHYLEECLKELKSLEWAIPAMKHFLVLCKTYTEGPSQHFQPINQPQNRIHTQQQYPFFMYRQHVIRYFWEDIGAEGIIFMAVNNLILYIEKARQKIDFLCEKDPSQEYDRNTFLLDEKYSHSVQVAERLEFLKDLFYDGALWIQYGEATKIWNALIPEPLFEEDRDDGFNWFAQLFQMENFDPESVIPFFDAHVNTLDSQTLSMSGLKCFEQFFKQVNLKENKLIIAENDTIHLKSYDLNGSSFLWKTICFASDQVANSAIEMMKTVFAYQLDNTLNVELLHQYFLENCQNHLRVAYDTLKHLSPSSDAPTIAINVRKLSRTLHMLYQYIAVYDMQFEQDRVSLPLNRMSHGRDIKFRVTFVLPQPAFSRFGSDSEKSIDFIIPAHSLQTMGHLRRDICHHIRTNVDNLPPNRIDIFCNQNWLDPHQFNHQLLEFLSVFIVDRTESCVKLMAKLHSSNSSRHQAFHNQTIPSSPESSSESSPGGSTQDVSTQEHQIELEKQLPGYLLSRNAENVEFLFTLADLGLKYQSESLQVAARLVIRQIPVCNSFIEQIISIPRLETPRQRAQAIVALFFDSSSTQILYNLELLYCLMFISDISLGAPKNVLTQLQYEFVSNNGLQCCYDMLVKNNFLAQADAGSKCFAMSILLKLLKFCLLAFVYSLDTLVRNVSKVPATRAAIPSNISDLVESYLWLPKNINEIAFSTYDETLQKVTRNIGRDAGAVVKLSPRPVPQLDHAVVIQKYIWAVAVSGQRSYLGPWEDIANRHKQVFSQQFDLKPSEIDIIELGFDNLTLCFMLSPTLMANWMDTDHWSQFVLDMLFSSSSQLRHLAYSKLLRMVRLCGDLQAFSRHRQKFLSLCIPEMDRLAAQKPVKEFFQFVSALISTCIPEIASPFIGMDDFLISEILWLKKAQEYTAVNMESYPDDVLLSGHLIVLRELVGLLPVERKAVFSLNHTAENVLGAGLIRDLLNEFILPASRMYADHRALERNTTSRRGKMQRSATDLPISSKALSASRTGLNTAGLATLDEDCSVDNTIPRSKTAASMVSGRCVPVCGPSTIDAAYKLIIVLTTNCLSNLTVVTEMLMEMFYADESAAINEWEYVPHIVLRPQNGFVGLKNGGATCYMNSVLQQLFMHECIRERIMSLDLGGNLPLDADEESSFLDTIGEPGSSKVTGIADQQQVDTGGTPEAQKNAYHLDIVRHLQLTYGHLLGSQLQFYVPRHFWRQFKFLGEPINIREQHDAVEFLDHLLDSVDETCKRLEHPPLTHGILGGTLADQKICKDCPHRYSRDAPFNYISVDIRNCSNLLAALEDYVRGELLEGADAYLCEKCNAKVDAVKRLCIKRLTRILPIQLKRFDYDWERECAVKFNDYFEFPRMLDMEPYTIQGLASKEGEAVDETALLESSSEHAKESLIYELTGVVVHSGQATGGHYYSYILHKQTRRWYKFDDGDVTDAQMDNDDEMRTHCFGGDYLGETYDQMLKKMSMRRQKRWWNAYILFYERVELSVTTAANEHHTTLAQQFGQMNISSRLRLVPPHIENAVRQANMQALHQKQQFCVEYFSFIYSLVHDNAVRLKDDIVLNRGELSAVGTRTILVLIQLVSKFLFMTGLHAKKSLRGPSGEWLAIMKFFFNVSCDARLWFIDKQLLVHEHRFARYSLESPSSDVRAFFTRLIATLALESQTDETCRLANYRQFDLSNYETTSDLLLSAMLNLLRRDVCDWGKHLTQFFTMFYSYVEASDDVNSIARRRQLLHLSVPYQLICLATELGPGPSIRCHNTDFSKLYETVSVLVRCYNVSASRLDVNASPGERRGYSPLAKQITMNRTEQRPEMPEELEQILFDQTKYVKKMLDDAASLQLNVELFKFLCWRSRSFSVMLINEIFVLLSHVMFGELKSLILVVLAEIIDIDDELKSTRTDIILKGLENTAIVGLIELISRLRSTLPRRAYVVFKHTIRLLDSSDYLRESLMNSGSLSRRFGQFADWLQDELNNKAKRVTNPFGWSMPHYESNETGATGFSIEPSKSAIYTLDEAKRMRELLGVEPTSDDTQNASDDEDDMRDVSLTQKMSHMHITSSPLRSEEGSPSSLCVSPAPSDPTMSPVIDSSSDVPGNGVGVPQPGDASVSSIDQSVNSSSSSTLRSSHASTPTHSQSRDSSPQAPGDALAPLPSFDEAVNMNVPVAVSTRLFGSTPPPPYSAVEKGEK